MYSLFIKTILVVIIEMTLHTESACPRPCVCKWVDGKETVKCADGNLTLIPQGLDGGTQVLDLNGNNLKVLQKHVFQKLGLLNLQKIYLSRCRIHKIDNQAFTDLTNLVELDISHNYITMIPTPNFDEISSLMKLILNKNPIRSIQSNAFQDLSSLTTLELSDCDIELIDTDGFLGLDRLERLQLNDNKLNTIQGEKIFPDTLIMLDLNNNPWLCDCKLRDLYNWLINFQKQSSFQPICESPNILKNRAITSLAEYELACLPNVSPTMLYLEINEGKNISLQCQVKAMPEAKVSWWFQGQILQNDSMIAPGIHFYYFLEEGKIDKTSELYIYNTNTEDNGTFSCIAENPAGKFQSNYTIRIIVKEEPIIIASTYPYEPLTLACGAVAILFFLLILVLTLALKYRCKGTNRNRKQGSKDIHDTNNSSKTSSLPNSNENISPKSNGNMSFNTQSHHNIHFPIAAAQDIHINKPFQETFGASYLNEYQPDKNPDLVNDTETFAIKKTVNEIDGFNENNILFIPRLRQVKWQDQQNIMGGMATLPRRSHKDLSTYPHSADVHLNPGCFLDSDGYPSDYGLPKVKFKAPPMSQLIKNVNSYQTLPNRSKVKNQTNEYSKQNGFNSGQFLSYEQYDQSDIRYTVEGYPFPRNFPNPSNNENISMSGLNFIPSPPEEYKSTTTGMNANTSNMSRSNSQLLASQWIGVTTNPSNCLLNTNNCKLKSICDFVHPDPVKTRCVPTQTSEQDRVLEVSMDISCIKSMPQVTNIKTESDLFSESPDEGYVGECTEATDI